MQDFFSKFSEYVDPKKSKYFLELLLDFLINFFETNYDCKGSGVIPRFNTKVTDMIFFAQGNGDDKIEANKEYFEDEWCYLKPLDGEDFKVDVRKLLEKKLPLQKLENPVNPAIRTKEETVNLPTTSSGQSSISSETSKNSSNNSDSAWSSIKNFFYSLFSGFISFITGLFTS